MGCAAAVLGNVKFFKRPSRFVFPFIAVGTICFAISCGILIYRGHEKIEALLHPSSLMPPTDVYSRWLDLKTPGLTRDYILAWLQALGYKNTGAAAPAAVEQFSVSDSDLTVYLPPFSYPDKDFPLQLLKLQFRRGILEPTDWRLPPKRLAQWARQSDATRPKIRLAELPPYVPGAIIAMEDKRFYHHGAIDPMGIARALWVDLRSGGLRQGASTLSQQLARSLFLDVHRTFKRKVLEAGLAFYLEARYDKPQLLEMYLNQVYWGQDGATALLGIESASESFFGKSARELTPAQSALLAGVLQSPNRFSPRASAKISQERRDRVLSLMHEQGIISKPVYRKALAEKIELAPTAGSGSDAAYFLSTLKDQLEGRYDMSALMSGGWRIFTTLDPVLESYAMQSVRTLRGNKAGPANHPEGALVALDARTGAILSWVGGTDFRTSSFDRAIYAVRQPGSAFKPFVALSALQNHSATLATPLDNSPITLHEGTWYWRPQNYTRTSGGKVSMADALVHSLNIPMVRLAMMVGIPRVIETAQQAGITSPLRSVPSLALGTSEVSVVELTGAYTTLANEGRRSTPYMVDSILSDQKVRVEMHSPDTQAVFQPDAVFLVTRTLQEVLTRGTGAQARAMGFKWAAAGKTGTSENYQDAWFVGYTPEIVCSVWVGYDKPRSLGHSAAGIALPVWTRFMNHALALMPPTEFKEPPGLTWKTVDPDSGLLVKSGCPKRERVPFLAGTEPTAACPLHQGGLFGFFKRWAK